MKPVRHISWGLANQWLGHTLRQDHQTFLLMVRDLVDKSVIRFVVTQSVAECLRHTWLFGHYLLDPVMLGGGVVLTARTYVARWIDVLTTEESGNYFYMVKDHEVILITIDSDALGI